MSARSFHRSLWTAGALLLAALASPVSVGAQRAYVANTAGDSVTAFDTRTGAVLGGPIEVGEAPTAIAISPDGKRAVVANFFSRDVSLIDTATNSVIGAPIGVDYEPGDVAIAPGGGFAIVPSGSPFDAGAVTKIDLVTGRPIGQPIHFERRVSNVAITPDGTKALVTAESGIVWEIDVAANEVVSYFDLGIEARDIAVTPDGRLALVASPGEDVVVAIDLVAGEALGQPIEVGPFPSAISISPDGRLAYSANAGGGSVTAIDVLGRRAIGEIPVPGQPWQVTFAPGGETAYVASGEINGVSTIDVAAGKVVGSPIPAGAQPEAVAIAPSQAPTAAFTSPDFVRPKVPVTFSGVGSSDPSGRVSRFAWTFGGGTGASADAPLIAQAFPAAGSYTVSLTVTNAEGCSTTTIFTGQTAYCNGAASAKSDRAVTVSLPTVRVSCPPGRNRPVCRFRLRAVGGKGRQARAQSFLATARVRPGKKRAVAIKPKPRFAAALATKKRILVRRQLRRGERHATVTRWLRVVG